MGDVGKSRQEGSDHSATPSSPSSRRTERHIITVGSETLEIPTKAIPSDPQQAQTFLKFHENVYQLFLARRGDSQATFTRPDADSFARLTQIGRDFYEGQFALRTTESGLLLATKKSGNDSPRVTVKRGRILETREAERPPESSRPSDVSPLASVHPSPRWKQVYQRIAEVIFARTSRRMEQSVADIQTTLTDQIRHATANNLVWIRVQPQALSHILRDGRLKTQFETASSRGVLNQELRARTEQTLFQYPMDLHPSSRPIYGYLANTSGISGPTIHYGSVALRLKDHIRPKATITYTDSLSLTDTKSFLLATPTPLEQPDFSTVNILRLEPGVTTQNFLLSTLETGYLNEFIEVQIHGGLSLDDIESVTFRNYQQATQSPELLHQLHELDIPTFHSPQHELQREYSDWERDKVEGRVIITEREYNVYEHLKQLGLDPRELEQLVADTT